jgi:hypothetical protein
MVAIVSINAQRWLNKTIIFSRANAISLGTGLETQKRVN